MLTARLPLLPASLFALAVAACAPSTPPPPAAPIAVPEREAPSAPSPAPTAPAPALRPSHCVAALARPGDPIAVAWPAGPFASAFWIVDQLSGWDDHYTSAVYPSWWHKRFPADARADELLRDYATVRRAHALAPSTEPDVAHPDDVLAPATAPADRFAATALCAAGPAEAAAALGLTAAEARAFTAAFEQLAPRIDEVLREATYLAPARARLEALAQRAEMGAFLGVAARFFGATGPLPAPLYVDIVWGPAGSQQATTLGGHMIVPISAEIAARDLELQGWLGVVVHEFGHYLSAQVSAEARAAISDRVVGTVGVVRQRHGNLVDEATQAALGNILFMRAKLPAAYDDDRVYAFEPRYEYPDAISALARAAAPHLERLLATPGAFGGEYLQRVLEEQLRVIPPRLDHHARTALVLTVGGDADRYFKGLFWGRSRWQFDTVAKFAAFSERGPSISRWVVGTAADLEAQPELAPAVKMGSLDDARAALRSSKATGCVAARRRPSGLGWDVAVVGRDRDGLRGALIAVSRGMEIPERKPFCLAARR